MRLGTYKKKTTLWEGRNISSVSKPKILRLYNAQPGANCGEGKAGRRSWGRGQHNSEARRLRKPVINPSGKVKACPKEKRRLLEGDGELVKFPGLQ